MAVYERSTLLRSKDDNGDEYLLYPITKLDCVDGAEDLVRVDKEQELTAAQKAQVLKNIGGLCAPVSAQVDKFLKVSAVDENGNVTAVEAVSVTQASENLDEVLTQQAELISELETALVNKASGGGVSGDVYWEDIHNKPFGETTELVDLLPLTQYDEFYLNESFGTYQTNDSAAYTLTVGEIYKVFWDGVEYECIAQDASSVMAGFIAIGNASGWGLSGNDEPFVIGYNPEQYAVYCALTDTEAGGSHEVRIAQEKPTVKYLDNKYLDFIEFIGAAGKELMPVQALTFQPDTPPEEGDPVQDMIFFSGIEVTESDPLTQLEPNKQYTVTFDGVEYTCTAIDLIPIFVSDPSEVPEGTKYLFLGNPRGELPGYADTGEPFTMTFEYMPTGDDTACAGFLTAMIEHTSADASVTHEVGIKEAGESKAVIKSEYLPDNLGGVTSWNDLEDKPFGETTDFVELLPSTEYTEFFSNPTFGCYQHNEPATYSLIVGDTYKIIWDGVEYECVVHDVSSLMDGYVAMGNGTSWGFAGNNEPFIIAQSPSQTLMYCSLTDDSVTPHTVQVFKKTTVIKTIDPKYLPTDIGGGSGGSVENPLPEIDESGSDNGKVLTVNGTEVEWQTPMTELPEVTDTDNGKVLTVNGTEVEWKAPAPALPEVSAADDGKVMTVVNGVWAAQTTTSAPALPEVSAADAGKFLRVSATGAWVAEIIPNAEEASF